MRTAVAEVYALGTKQHGVVTTAQAIGCGMSRRAVEWRVGTGSWRPLERGTYALPGSPDTWEQRATGRALAHGPDGAISHLGAAALLGLIEGRPDVIDVTVPYGRRAGRGVHRARAFSRKDVRRVSGIPVTCPSLTLVDLAGVVPRELLEAMLDTALLGGLVSIPSLRRYIRDRGLANRRGAGRLSELLRDREGGVPNRELERKFERLVRRYRLPVPDRQVKVGRRRIDYAYPDRKVAVELDGRKDHGKKRVFEEDRRRQNEIVLAGWTVLRFTWDDVTKRPEMVARILRQALAG